MQASRKQADKFAETWTPGKVNLSSSAPSMFAYIFLAFLKSPHDIRDGLLSRLLNRRRANLLFYEGFLSVLSQVLYYYFATSARSKNLFLVLEKVKTKYVFVIDEFWSINTVNVKKLKELGQIVYVSQDVAYNRYGFRNNFISRNLMWQLERKIVAQADLVIACTNRDRLKYIEMGAKKAVFYPNIYPLEEFEPVPKDNCISISIVSRGHWGPKLNNSLKQIFNALSTLGQPVKVYLIGIKPSDIPKNVTLEHYEYLPSKLDYLRLLSKSWIGINIGFHLAGSNERKYDYALSGLVVFSDILGARGDLLTYEYAYVDSQDLAGKIQQLLEFGSEQLREMGLQNRKQALRLATQEREQLTKVINELHF